LIEVTAAPCKRGQQHAAQRVAERQAKAALKRFGDEGRLASCIAARLLFELLGFLSSCQFLVLTAMIVPLGLGAGAVRLATD
jgi:hypothetical protein